MRASFEGSVFIATSLDGFIARRDGSLDWLPGADGQPADADAPSDGDYGYASFLASVDAILMGRATYDAVLGFGEWPYGTKPVVVLTTRDLVLPADPSAVVSGISGAAADVARRLVDEGRPRVYLDGGRTIQQFLAAGLVGRLVITRIPVLLGEGIPLFGPLSADLTLRHEATEAFASGLVQSTYRID
jgi:dihydrofolate reductase